MKCYILALLLFAYLPVIAQSTSDSIIFSNTHGLINGSSHFFEVEGYSVFTAEHDRLSFDKRGLRKAKRKYDIDKKNEGQEDTTFKFIHKVFVENYEMNEDLVQKNIYYFTPMEGNNLRVIGFATQVSRDIEVERIFVNAFLNNNIPAKVYTSAEIDSINFAGRYLPLGSACNWMNPHNVQCPDFGQMSWSECRTIERANEIIQHQFEVTNNKKMGKVIAKDTIDVVFEGKKCTALRMKYKIKVPRLIMGGSNILMIYYIATKVRGKYVACVLSQYIDDSSSDSELAPLLQFVMEKPE